MINLIKKPAIIYSRRSTDKNQKHSLAAQKWICKQFATNNGFYVVAEYEETKSGKTVADREALQLAIAEAESTGAVIVTATISRLGRSVAEVSTLLAHSKIKFIFCDLGLEADATMVMMYLVFSEAEARKISERTSRSIAQARRANPSMKWGNPQMGLMREKSNISNRQRGMKTAKNTMPMIEAIRAMGITSMRGIARKLNELNYPTPKGKKWYATSISKIIERVEG